MSDQIGTRIPQSRRELECHQSDTLVALLSQVLPHNRFWRNKFAAAGISASDIGSRADLHKLSVDLGPLLFGHPLVQFWVPTLDGRFWTGAELSWDIAHTWGVYIPANRIWANQGKGQFSGSGGPWDTSILFGRWF